MSEMTLEQFNAILPGTVFAKGESIDNETGLNMLHTNNLLKWVAVKGWAEDWAIYVHLAENSFDYVRQFGDKVFDAVHIKRVVPCTDEVFARYRY